MNRSKRPRYLLCHHCEKELSIKRFKEHERLFFNKDTKEWIKNCESGSVRTSGSESGLSDFSDFGELECCNLASDSSEVQDCQIEDEDPLTSLEIEDFVVKDDDLSESNDQQLQQQGEQVS